MTTIALLTLAAPAASAQERGVFIDPDSPAGTEYAIPLDAARRDAAGGNADLGSAPTSEQPMFGAGITPRGEERPARRGGSRGSAGQGGAGDGDAAPSTQARSTSGSTAAIAAAADEGSSDTLLTLGLAGAVLAVGLVAGLAFRRSLNGR